MKFRPIYNIIWLVRKRIMLIGQSLMLFKIFLMQCRIASGGCNENDKAVTWGRIKELHRARWLAQEALAEAIGIEPQYMSRIETGGSAPTVERMERLCSVLDVELRSLFDFSHLDSREAQLESVEEMLKSLDENDLKVVYRVVRSFRG
ncbi:helix-turn-helix transcriptional regulator [Trichlorobacter sp.]|uniref:helix-turn-helix domain-containing protein n=1 Tax=Trichlorobacter sp. TaxID=2911007 RepID=UPI002A35ABC9|nr:helix-turn-helix transcriptional regulator [Trichlorobacter sp.]MDY0383735.1 helix-turn-helix transcriptional regulator [Trichlorobacter sp.]